jgi:hypothetical protein
VTHPRNTSSDHARHDRLVVVRYLDLDDDLLEGEVSQARALLASCTDCAALATELQLISDATNRMALPSRPRDFRLTAQQAAALQPGGFRRFVQNLGAAFRFEFLRPLAGAAVAIGLLLAVVGTLPSFQPGPSAGSPAGSGGGDSQLTSGQDATAAPASSAGAVIAPEATRTSDRDTQSPGAGVAGQSQLPAMTLVSTPPAPDVQPTTKQGDLSTTSPDTSMENSSAPTTSAGSQPYGPAATDATTAAIPGGTPEAAVPPAQGNGAGGALATNRATDGVSPLVILGVLLASIGLVVMLLTVVSRRIRRSAG